MSAPAGHVSRAEPDQPPATDHAAPVRLRDRDARLRAGQELTGLAWWELDPATGQHVWSDAMFRLVGLPPSVEAPDHDAYLAMIHPDDRPAAVALRQQGFSTGHRDVHRVVHPAGG